MCQVMVTEIKMVLPSVGMMTICVGIVLIRNILGMFPCHERSSQPPGLPIMTKDDTVSPWSPKPDPLAALRSSHLSSTPPTCLFLSSPASSTCHSIYPLIFGFVVCRLSGGLRLAICQP
jgi:hypothetical protein